MAKKGKKRSNQKKASPASGLVWDFPSTNGGEEQGFADSQLTYFRGNKDKYVARETIQNAVDAKIPDSEGPVVVEFERFLMDTADLPGGDMLLERMRRCLEFIGNRDEKAKKFFENAITLLEGKKIHALRISDYNTIGLSGEDADRNGGWYQLVKASGASNKKSTAGGSFGIGKGAPINASSLHTVFYSTVSETGGQAFQGKSRLVSHFHYDEQKKKEDVRQSVGFFGVPSEDGIGAVRDAANIPNRFKRTERGTDIYIIGSNADDDWDKELITTILYNFWLTILHGHLEIVIKDGETRRITKDNLKEWLEEFGADDARYFYEAVTNYTKPFEKDLPVLGKVFLFVRKEEGYPKRVMKVRKPRMLVEDKQYAYLRDPYAAVFICDDDKGNRILREMEPPAHDKWDKDLAPEGRAALKEIDEFIRESLRSMGEVLSSEPQDIPGLDRYLPDSEDRDYDAENDSTPMDPSESFGDQESGREVGAEREPKTEKAEPVARKAPIVKTPATGFGGSRGESNDGTGGDDAGDDGTSGEDEGEGSGERIRTPDISFRSFVQKSKGALEYHFVITGRENCKGAIRVIAIGDDGSYPVDVQSATDSSSKKRFDINGSLIKGISVKSGRTVRLAVKLQSKQKYALGIENYEG